jgi:hypothetical protein
VLRAPRPSRATPPPREDFRGGVVIERVDNIGRWHLKVLTARQIEAGALKNR